MPTTSVIQFLESKYSRSKTFKEGTKEFDDLRSCLLRQSDRYIFLAVSNYVRTLDILRGSSSAWAVVGLYYASFFAAHGILGILGCFYKRAKRWVEVANANPGSQSLKYSIQKYPNPGNGSHREFWHAYYSAIASVASWLPAQANLAVSPISADPEWFIELRNRVNYDPLEAFQLSSQFDAALQPSNIPGCFPGELSSAHQVTVAFLFALKEIAQQTNLKTDVFAPSRSRETAIRGRINGSRCKALSDFTRNSAATLEF